MAENQQKDPTAPQSDEQTSAPETSSRTLAENVSQAVSVSKETRMKAVAVFVDFLKISLAMVVALSWNEVIPTFVRMILPGIGGVVGLLIYALVTTAIAVGIILMVGKYGSGDGIKKP